MSKNTHKKKKQQQDNVFVRCEHDRLKTESTNQIKVDRSKKREGSIEVGFVKFQIRIFKKYF